MGMNFEWTPNVGVGPILFGASIQEYVDAGLLFPEKMHAELGGDIDYFDADGQMMVSPDYDNEHAVGVIGCDETLLYNGEELIGISLEQAVTILGREPDGEPEAEEMYDDTVQTIAYFDALGLDLWFLNDLSVYAGLDAFENGSESSRRNHAL